MDEDQDFVLPSPEKRPVVSFAVFSYNQEKYIKEAVEGAFSQTYEPLEIILSDDCSTDKTYKIMEKMAAEYKGKHKLILNRNENNLGNVNHVIRVANIASGNFFVLAAGDDISYKDRVTYLTSKWIETKAVAICSFHDAISESGEILESNVSFPTDLPGFSASYETDFWRQLPYSRDKIYAEDGLAAWILRVRNQEIVRIKKPLMSYRILSDSLSIRSEPRKILDVKRREEKINKSGLDLYNSACFIIQNAFSSKNSVSAEDVLLLANDINYASIVTNFWEKNFFERILSLKKCRDKKSINFVVPRILGFSTFAVLRIVLGNIRRILSKN